MNQSEVSRKIQRAVTDAVEGERNRIGRIIDLCEDAGRPMLAIKYIEDGRSVEEAQNQLVRLGPMPPHVKESESDDGVQPRADKADRALNTATGAYVSAV